MCLEPLLLLSRCWCISIVGVYKCPSISGMGQLEYLEDGALRTSA